MKTTDLPSVIATAAVAGVRPMLWGAPGIGKTAAVRAAADQLGAELVVLELSTLEPTDIGGAPYVWRGEYRVATPAWARRLAAAPRGLLFLDELTTARPVTLDAAVNLILDGRVNDEFTLPRTVAIVCAGNPAEHTHGGASLSSALSNRLAHIQCQPPSVDDWLAIVTGTTSTPPIAVPESIDERAYRLCAQAVARARAGKGLVGQPPAGGGAYLTPRSAEALCRWVAAATAARLADHLIDEVAVGIVGEGPWTEIATVLRDPTFWLPTPADIIAGTPWPDTPAGALEVGRALAAAIESGAIDAAAGWTAFNRLFDDERVDFGIPVLSAIVAACARHGVYTPGLERWLEACQ
ncbi:MAG: hypothetical protein KatS3mg060_1138 [Dehalococcoidia bacterium]|nr:MAG: hypothetical protein KatS3mg060_1138 [Dehalococcoidia bacterium]